jgi:hypothetical protein
VLQQQQNFQHFELCVMLSPEGGVCSKEQVAQHDAQRQTSALLTQQQCNIRHASTQFETCILLSPEGCVCSKEEVAQHDAQRPHVSLHSIVRVGGVERRLQHLQRTNTAAQSTEQEESSLNSIARVGGVERRLQHLQASSAERTSMRFDKEHDHT